MKLLKVVIVLAIMVVVPICYQGLQRPTAAAPKTRAPISPLYQPELGDPIFGLNSEELGRFFSGKIEFEREHSAEDGLGPNFNGTSCRQCHGLPVTGGALISKDDLTVRVGRTTKNGNYSGLKKLGGEPLSFLHTVPGCEKQLIPKKAQHVSFRAGQQLFGFGLIDSISDSEILSHADPDDKDHDGIKGHANIVFSIHYQQMMVGRFGWKAHMPTLFDFSADAYLVEIGISSPDLPHNRVVNGAKSICDPDTGPEDSDGRVTNAFVDFMSFLAPPTQKPMDSSAQRGQLIFSDIGCAKCHIPTLRTASTAENPNMLSPVLANQDVTLYSDLLLHEMGDKLFDGIETGQAKGGEWRTQPLFGLSSKQFLLHDGRTTDLKTAILEHGGEAQGVIDRFSKLSAAQRTDLLNFLRTL